MLPEDVTRLGCGSTTPRNSQEIFGLSGNYQLSSLVALLTELKIADRFLQTRHKTHHQEGTMVKKKLSREYGRVSSTMYQDSPRLYGFCMHFVPLVYFALNCFNCQLPAALPRLIISPFLTHRTRFTSCLNYKAYGAYILANPLFEFMESNRLPHLAKESGVLHVRLISKLGGLSGVCRLPNSPLQLLESSVNSLWVLRVAFPMLHLVSVARVKPCVEGI
jgi:hypothetical protein